jgi:predicted permease
MPGEHGTHQTPNGESRSLKEGQRERRLPAFESALRDLRHAFRTLHRDLGFSVVAVLILAIGIGANTAVFSVVNTVLLRPLPFRDAGRLVWIENTGEKNGLSGETYPVGVFEEYRRLNRSLESMTAYFAFFGYGSYKLTGRGEPERLMGVTLSTDFFDVLGVKPEFGRPFLNKEGLKNGPLVALLSHGFWQRRFGGDPSIVGQSLVINGQSVTVVGVMGRGFDFSSVFSPATRVDLYMPAVLDEMRNWGNTMALIGRMKPGVTVDGVRADFRLIIPEVDAAHPEWKGWANAARISSLQEHVSGSMRRPLFVLWAAVALVLVIVCVNLANLLLARESGRSKEIAVRVALGAGRFRLMQQLVTESLVLATAGAALGVGVAYAALRYVTHSAAFSIPLLQSVRLDGAALAFTVLAAVALCLLFAVIPGLRMPIGNPAAALRAWGRGATDAKGHAWIRSALVVAEIALACVLLSGAGLLLRSFLRLLDVDLGFQPARAAAFRIDPPGNPTLAQRHAFLAEVVRRAETVPGVETAGITDALPLDRNRAWGLQAVGKSYPKDADTTAFVYIVGPGFLGAMGTPLHGRDFNEGDTEKSQRVVIISRTAARTHFPGQDPLGRKMFVGGPPEQWTVVGVAADTRQRSVEDGGAVQMYLPETQAGPEGADLVIRTLLAPAAVAPGVRTVLRQLDPSLATGDFRPISQLVESAVSPRRFVVSLLALFASFALLLASLGIYGVIASSVNRRAQEIGIRMALGASAWNVRWRIIAGTLRLAAMGLAAGLAASLLLARLIASLLYGVSAFDPVTFAGMCVVLSAVALLAGYLPAWRASRIDPMFALRAD